MTVQWRVYGKGGAESKYGERMGLMRSLTGDHVTPVLWAQCRLTEAETQATLPIHSFIHSTGNPLQASQQTCPLMCLKHVTSVHVSEFGVGKSDSKQRTAADKIFRQASRAVH